MKKNVRYLICVLLCAGLTALIVGGSAFFARHNTAYRQKRTQPLSVLRLSTFTELDGYGHITLCAHRGLSGSAPENTMEAIRAADAAGFSRVQLDVAVCADSVFVLFHDETLERMTAQTGRLSFCPLETLRRLPLDNGANIDAYDKVYIPTLREALALCKSRGMIPVLNVRSMDPVTLNALHKILKDQGTYVLCASDMPTLHGYRSLDAECALQYRVGTLTDKAIRAAKENGWTLVFDCTQNKADSVAAYAGTVPLCAETVNTRDTLVRLVRAGVTEIVTDCILPPSQK